jgi:hypothetical protein
LHARYLSKPNAFNGTPHWKYRPKDLLSGIGISFPKLITVEYGNQEDPDLPNPVVV